MLTSAESAVSRLRQAEVDAQAVDGKAVASADKALAAVAVMPKPSLAPALRRFAPRPRVR